MACTTDVESFESVASCRSKAHESDSKPASALGCLDRECLHALRARIGNTYLEIAVSILLLENQPDRLIHID